MQLLQLLSIHLQLKNFQEVTLCFAIIVFQVDTDGVADAGDITNDDAVLMPKEAGHRDSGVNTIRKLAKPSKNGLKNNCMFGWFRKLVNNSKHRCYEN